MKTMLNEQLSQELTKRHQRTRTGCVTCRIRKIKCDEIHPACRKCTSTGRKCDGYKYSKTVDRSVSSRVMMIVTDFERAACDESTGYALRFFYERSAPALTNYSSNQFWSQIVLQACLVEPSIRDLAVAAASLERSRRFANLYDASSQERIYMLHYGRALKRLSSHSDVGIILTGCLLLVLCEDMQANSYAALTHINAGRRLLVQNFNRLDRDLLTDLGAIFRSLVIHSPELAAEIIRIQFLVSKGNGISSRLPYLSGGKSLDSGFRNMEQAAAFLLSMREPCIQAGQFPRPLTRFHSIPGITMRLNDWLECFNIFNYFMSDEQQEAHRNTIHSLRIYHLILDIVSRCASYNDETVYDIYANNFDGLVKRLCILSELGPTGIQSLLFFVACKYRDVAGRRRCVELLRYQTYGAEGAFLADIAEQIAAMEETGVEEPITSSDIPKTLRVRPHKIIENPRHPGQRILVVSRAPFTLESSLSNTFLPFSTYAVPGVSSLEWENNTLQRAIDLQLTMSI